MIIFLLNSIKFIFTGKLVMDIVKLQFRTLINDENHALQIDT